MLPLVLTEERLGLDVMWGPGRHRRKTQTLEGLSQVQGPDSLINPEVQNQGWKGDPLCRRVVDHVQNLQEQTGGSGEGTHFLFPKMFRWRLEARNFHILGRA